MDAQRWWNRRPRRQQPLVGTEEVHDDAFVAFSASECVRFGAVDAATGVESVPDDVALDADARTNDASGIARRVGPQLRADDARLLVPQGNEDGTDPEHRRRRVHSLLAAVLHLLHFDAVFAE